MSARIISRLHSSLRSSTRNSKSLATPFSCPSPSSNRFNNPLFVPSLRTVSVSATSKKNMPKTDMDYAQGLVDFLNEAWTPFHAVAEGKRRLIAAGFKELDESAKWDHVTAGGRYFFTRNQSTLVAFVIGSEVTDSSGFHVIGAHTDSPCLKLKPISKSNKSNFLNLGVETYGGGLWTTWFDRDLTVAGRVLVKTNNTTTTSSSTSSNAAGSVVVQRLVKIPRPILRIPMLAIHLNREISTDGFKPNTQQHLSPVLATAVKGALLDASGGASGSTPPTTTTTTPSTGGNEMGMAATRHHPLLVKLLAEEMKCDPKDIIDFELQVCDIQPATLGGAQNEFIFSGRLDNLCMSYCALTALIDSLDNMDVHHTQCIALFDHEEVGSESAQGAGGPVMMDTIRRVARLIGGQRRRAAAAAASSSQSQQQKDDQDTTSVDDDSAVERALQNSFLVSADMAHALHPNYPDKHEPEHSPSFHRGLVIKHNGNQRYATNLVSAHLFREVASRRNIPTQDFVVRNDMACGSTIGPIVAANTGIRTVDVGAPQLSMHSIREMCGTDDVAHACRHFTAFFSDFGKIKNTIKVDNVTLDQYPELHNNVGCDHVH